ncbi:MAG: guanylate kinase [Xanthomonadales bacterium]|nr:guanylate kinase [Gammaproteobacteria bacterium]MBT8055078.1 guanylate kinase [Gammaproteobacteria bacterium]NND58231.1 guanylate kinase [Xanthomonadales bacterium]NNK51672.1 guanylate kinase [Xanthomonadales bacterium]
MNDPNLFVVAAPSGGGKTSLINALLKTDERVRLSVSHTTRPPRPGEQDGVHYHFVNEASFLKLADENAFLENARVFDCYYGTGRKAVEQQLASGFDVLLDIDWQGARQVRAAFPSCCTVFIIPPSIEVLRQRLVRRGQDTERVIRRRMREARAEISHWDEFDFIIINDVFEQALADLQTVIRFGKLNRPETQERRVEILAELLGSR